MPEHEGCLGPSCKCHSLISKPEKGTKNYRNNSKAQERAIAKDYVKAGFPKAHRVPGSGAFVNLPADVDTDSLLLLECKMTRTGKMTLQPAWLEKTEQQAKKMGRPFYALHAWVADKTHPFDKWICIREDYFFELLRRLNEAEGQLNDPTQ